MEQHPLDTDVLQLFEEYAQPEQLTADQVAEELADDGLVDHFRKLANADLITRDMSLANYIQFAEVRGQATFVGHKSPSKRFMEFIRYASIPLRWLIAHCAAFAIVPIS